MKALFLDRDGVINRMVRYGDGWDSPQDTADVRLVDGIVNIIRWANKNNVLVIEVSNQPGVAKGKMSQDTADNIERQIHDLLSKRGVYIDHQFICPHHPEAEMSELAVDCDCRKPKPGLLIRSARELDIDLPKSIFLGDKITDVQAGKSAGCTTAIFLHAEDEPTKVELAAHAGADISSTNMKNIEEYIKKLLA